MKVRFISRSEAIVSCMGTVAHVQRDRAGRLVADEDLPVGVLSQVSRAFVAVDRRVKETLRVRY